MTNERAIQILENLISINGDIIIGDEGREALEMAVRSLQQEQQEVDLEEEIERCWENWLSPSNQPSVEGVLPKSEFTMYTHHFYNLGKNSK